ncbi:MAG TPA: PEP/pyruvate-binding domain-containing protein, partial [Anaerolineales bacterium]|nr:PEP/pyruvate-binding domain-containing protein [Anaerolineales bacterium]
MNYIRWFEEISSADIDKVGGKGANLGVMAGAGFPVPPGFCLTAQAYRDFIDETHLGESIKQILAEVDPGDTDQVETLTGSIRNLITAQQVPDDMAREILEGYDQLGLKLGLVAPTLAAVAVRSSATAEDLPTASFAGQQDTYLNVRGAQALLEHIKRCWASLWTARAVTYRAKQGFDHHKVYLAVVVQTMIPSEVSGIMFTANPVDGDRDVAVINASWGLGEAIVSGLVTPDTLNLNKLSGEILVRQIASKECAIQYSEDGGIITVQTPPEYQGIPALNDQQAQELVALGRKIEAHYGAPQDIEWACFHGQWFVLQARPITTMVKPEEAASPTDEFNRTMFLEIFPDPLSPSFCSVVQSLFHSMLDFTFSTWGFKPSQEVQAVGIFYSQPYFNRNYIEAALNRLSSRVREPLVSQIVNPFGDYHGKTHIEPSWPYLRMVVRTVRFMVDFPQLLPSLLARYHAEVEDITTLPEREMSDADLVAAMKHVLFGSTRQLLDYDFLLIAVTKRVFQLMGDLLEPYFGEEAGELRSKLVSGMTGNATMKTNIYLWDLAQMAKASPSVRDALRERNDGTLIQRLEESTDGRAFLDELNKFLKTFGHREVRLDILYPTWCEDPSPVFNFMRGYLDVREDQNPHAQQARLAQQRQELKEQVKARLARDSKGRHLIWPVFSWLLEHIEFHTRERDTMHFEMTRIFPPFRRILKELETRWSACGVIEEPDDVFFLTLDEWETLAAKPVPMG